MAVTAAYADGDPASDYLLTYQVFYPYYAKTHKASLARLQSTVADANKRHFTIRVAVITSPRGRRAGGTHSPTMTLNTYGHVMDELAGGSRAHRCRGDDPRSACVTGAATAGRVTGDRPGNG
jgi:hypothetical protein